MPGQLEDVDSLKAEFTNHQVVMEDRKKERSEEQASEGNRKMDYRRAEQGRTRSGYYKKPRRKQKTVETISRRANDDVEIARCILDDVRLGWMSG